MPLNINLLPKVGPDSSLLTRALNRSIAFLQSITIITAAIFAGLTVIQLVLLRNLSITTAKIKQTHAALPREQSTLAQELTITKDKLSLISKIIETKDKKSTTLKKVLEIIPSGITMTELGINDAQSFNFKGFSPDHFLINNLFRNLESFYIKDLRLKTINQNPINNEINFTITGQFSTQNQSN